MSMPAIILNISPAICGAVPGPGDARLSLPGLALACAMNSGTVFAGNDGGTSMKRASRLMLATGAMSRTKSNGSLA